MRKTRTGQRICDEPVYQVLRTLWELFDYQCERLVVLMRTNMEVLQAQPECAINVVVSAKLRRISAATVNRLLKSERRKLQIAGGSHTRHETLLKHQILVRTYFGGMSGVPATLSWIPSITRGEPPEESTVRP